jgi:hypothetical protein
METLEQRFTDCGDFKQKQRQKCGLARPPLHQEGQRLILLTERRANLRMRS